MISVKSCSSLISNDDGWFLTRHVHKPLLSSVMAKMRSSSQVANSGGQPRHWTRTCHIDCLPLFLRRRHGPMALRRHMGQWPCSASTGRHGSACSNVPLLLVVITPRCSTLVGSSPPRVLSFSLPVYHHGPRSQHRPKLTSLPFPTSPSFDSSSPLPRSTTSH